MKLNNSPKVKNPTQSQAQACIFTLSGYEIRASWPAYIDIHIYIYIYIRIYIYTFTCKIPFTPHAEKKKKPHSTRQSHLLAMHLTGTCTGTKRERHKTQHGRRRCELGNLRRKAGCRVQNADCRT